MTVLEYIQLRDREPWLGLPEYNSFTENGRKGVANTSVEDAIPKRVARLMSRKAVELNLVKANPK